MDIQYKEEEIGKEYSEELKKVVDIRKERKNIYGDSFLQEDIMSILSIIDGKRRRFDTLYKNKGIVQWPKIRDEIYDVINYYLFLSALLEKEEQNA